MSTSLELLLQMGRLALTGKTVLIVSASSVRTPNSPMLCKLTSFPPRLAGQAISGKPLRLCSNGQIAM
jgi:hypothetical protein